MSKPKSSNRDYGYQPNMASGVVDMESVVTNEGMRMAGKIEKHSEFMRPDTMPSYDAMEYNYPYPPNVPPPTGIVTPGQNWPPTTPDTDYTPEVFRCLANYCCCEGKLSKQVEISCTYPIVAGPWIVKSDGSKCTIGIGRLQGSSEVNTCANWCSDTESCPPMINVMLQSPAQTRMRKGKKETYPGQIRQTSVFMLEDIGCPACPVVTPCCTGASITGMPQMNVGETQTLTATGPVSGCTYQMKIISGGGALRVNGENSYAYTAPSSNPGCVNNATIGLYDMSTCQKCAQITIAINGYTGTEAAGFKYDSPGTCDGWGTCVSTGHIHFFCDGSSVHNTSTENCGLGCTSGQPCNCVPATDDRTPAMLAAGCCPSQLI